MRERSRFLSAAELTLAKFARPMTAKEIYDRALSEGYLDDNIAGITPVQTLKSKLSTHILNEGPNSLFVRTGKGYFALRSRVKDSDVYVAKRWEPAESRERVMVVPSAAFSDEAVFFQGLSTALEPGYSTLLRSGICVEKGRQEAEATEDFKQVITYVLVRRRGAFLAFRRGVYNNAPDSLRGADCIGFGGHVSAEDWDLFADDDAGVVRGAIRELGEELRLPDADVRRLNDREGLSIRGIINDDSSGVGRRHFAVILEYEVSDDAAWDDPQRGEESITQLRWIGGDTGAGGVSLSDFEYWSQLCLREFGAELVEAQPSTKLRRRAAFKTPHLLCVIGEIGSGKSEATRVLVEELGYAVVNSGRVLADLMGMPPIPQTNREEFQAAAFEFIMRDDSPRVFAEALSAEADILGGDRVAIDGIRHVATLTRLREIRGGTRVPVLYVATTPDTAFEFYRSREREGAGIREFLQVRDSPVEQDVPLMLQDADAVLFNWFGRAEFRHALIDLLGQKPLKGHN